MRKLMGPYSRVHEHGALPGDRENVAIGDRVTPPQIPGLLRASGVSAHAGTNGKTSAA
jgi:hypothetical protein